MNVNWAEPEIDTDPAYIEAANNDLHFNLGWFAKPILVDGQYPEVMREKVLRTSNSSTFFALDDILPFSLLFVCFSLD